MSELAVKDDAAETVDRPNVNSASSSDTDDTENSWTVLDEEPEENLADATIKNEMNDDNELTNKEEEALNESEESHVDEERIQEVRESDSSDIEAIDELESIEHSSSFSSSISDLAEDDSWLPRVPRLHLLATPYPPEELPHGYAAIQKGQTYSHEPNARLNLLLTSLLVLCLCLVIGLGLGHFLGWSERLELQELYADVMEERLEEMEDNLVTCMTGAEGQGGDDQDLDDKIIQRLHTENEQLKDELERLRTNDEETVDDELIAILRDRINDLLVVNDRLEKEVLRLRNSQLQEKVLQSQQGEEESIRTLLNDLNTENEQLRIALAKARYSKPALALEEKERLNMVVTENEELRAELRRMRYGLNANQGNVDDESSNDEGYVSDDNEEDASNEVNESGQEPKNEETLPKPDLSDLGFVGLLRDSLEPERISRSLDRVGEKLQVVVERLRPKMEKVKSKVDRIAAGVSNVIGNAFETNKQENEHDDTNDEYTRKSFFAYVENTIKPLMETGGSMTSALIKDLKQSMEDTWTELDTWAKSESVQRSTKRGKKEVQKLMKSFNKAMKKAQKAFKLNVKDASEIIGSVKDELVQTLNYVKGKFEEYSEDYYQEENPNTCILRSSNKSETSTGVRNKDEDEMEKNVLKKHKSWLFDRAQERDKARREAQTGEWLFERAQYRKQRQKFNAANWYERKMMRDQHHHDDDDDDDDDDFVHGRHGHHRRGRVGREQRRRPNRREWE